jgi:hypothetical protein
MIYRENDVCTVINKAQLKKDEIYFFGGYMVSKLCNIRHVRNIDLILNKTPIKINEFDFNKYFSEPIIKHIVLDRHDIKIVKIQTKCLNNLFNLRFRFFWIDNFPCTKNNNSLYMTPQNIAVSKYFAQTESPRNYFDFAKHIVDLSILYHTFGETILLDALNKLKDYYGRKSGMFPVNIYKATNRFFENQSQAVKKMEALDIDSKYHSVILSGAVGLSKMIREFLNSEKNLRNNMGFDI